MNLIKTLLELHNKKEFRKVISIGNKNLEKYHSDTNVLNILALAYIEDGQLKKAHSILSKAYDINKSDQVTIYNYAKVSRSLNLTNESINLYTRLINLNPFHIQAKNNLAEIFLANYNYIASEKLFLECLDISENYRLALDGLCELYHKSIREDKKKQVVLKTYNLYPNDIKAVLAYISNLLETNQLLEADKQIQQYKKDHNNLELMLLHCTLCSKKGNFNEMKINIEKVLSQYPDCPDAQIMMIKCLLQMQGFVSAENFAKKCFCKTILDKTKSEKSYELLLSCCQVLDDKENALKICEEWHESFPKSLIALSWLASNYLTNGQFVKGYKYYKFRHYENPLAINLKNYNDIKEWNMTEPYEHLLVLTEQGIGDEVMFMRLLETFTQHENITLAANIRLESIIRDSFKFKFISKDMILDNINYLDEFSHYIFLGDMCEKFINNTTKLNFESKRYLYSNRELLDKYKKMFYEPEKLNVGISWFTNNSDRFLSNLSDNDLEYISKNKYLNLINLQYDAQSTYLKKFNIKYDKTINYKQNLRALFSIISSCDFVITIDNCVAHFSGALGLKTYLLLPKQHDWRWFEETKKSIWYENLHIFRQRKNGDYASLITEIITDIRKEKALDK